MSAVAAPASPAQSPWRTIWLSPRVTIRRVVDSEHRPGWVPVVALAAVGAAISSIQLNPDGETLSLSRSATPVIISVLQLIFGVLVGPFFLAFAGGWLGGEADPVEIRQAVAWSYVPVAALTLLWIPLLLAYGTGAFRGELTPQSALQWVAFPAALAILVAYIWSVVVLVAALAEVQRFSIAKAIVSLIILIIPILLLGGLR